MITANFYRISFLHVVIARHSVFVYVFYHFVRFLVNLYYPINGCFFNVKLVSLEYNLAELSPLFVIFRKLLEDGIEGTILLKVDFAKNPLLKTGPVQV